MGPRELQPIGLGGMPRIERLPKGYLRLRLRLRYAAVGPPEGSVAVEVARGESLQ